MRRVVAAGVLLLSVPLAALELPTVTLDVRTTFAGERVNHGRREGAAYFQFESESGVALFGGHGYVGMRDVLHLEDSGWGNIRFAFNEMSPYAGFSRGVSDRLLLDCKVLCHRYHNGQPLRDAGWELSSVGTELCMDVSWDGLLHPRLCAGYDLSRRELCLIGEICHIHDMERHGLRRLSLELSGELGYDHATRPFGLRNYPTAGDSDYLFWGLGCDLVHHFNGHAKYRCGVHWKGNGAGRTDWVNGLFGGHRNFCWLQTAFECNF